MSTLLSMASPWITPERARIRSDRTVLPPGRRIPRSCARPEFTLHTALIFPLPVTPRRVWLLLRTCVHPQMERHRVRCVNEGHARLRRHLPQELEDKRLSKVEILRAAITISNTWGACWTRTHPGWRCHSGTRITALLQQRTECSSVKNTCSSWHSHINVPQIQPSERLRDQTLNSD